MISAIGAPGASRPILVPSAARSSDTSLNKSNAAGTVSPSGADVFSLSQPESLATSDGFFQGTSFAVRGHCYLREMDDGRIRAMSHTKLRFRYNFEAADGTKIHVRVKANLHYSQIGNTDEGSRSIRLRAKAAVSILQENVSSGVTPLLEIPEVSAEAKNRISQAIDLFYQVADAAAALFFESDPLDGDGLIAGLVDAFNGLSESISSIFLPPSADDPEPMSSGEVMGVLQQVASDPGEVLTVAPNQIEAVPLTNVESEPLSGGRPQDIAQSSGPENELVDRVAEGDASGSDKVVLPEGGEMEGPSPAQEIQPATSEQSQRFVNSVMFRLRLQVIQSLTSLVGVFDSDSPSVMATQSIFRASAQLAARYDLGAFGGSDSTSDDNGIDTQV